jgi:hypothetical protein
MLRNTEKLPFSGFLSSYNDQFFYRFIGPDICGPGTKKVHVIFSYKGKNHLVKKEIRCKVSWLA